MIVALPTECASYYKNDAIFGEKVRNAFPSAMYDADEARLSIAFERSTACVFHLMRVMEVGIRSLARCLAIPDPIKPAERNWGIMLRRIRDAIDTKWPSTANRIQGDGALFDSIFASLDAVKNPWRNGTMHVEKKYTREEAVHIFNNVVMFMRELAQRMDENGNPPA